MAEAGGAEAAVEDVLTLEVFTTALGTLLDGPGRLARMAEAARSGAVPDAAEKRRQRDRRQDDDPRPSASIQGRAPAR